MSEGRVCTRCKEFKFWDKFYTQKKSWCKSCCIKQDKFAPSKQPSIRREWHRQYYQRTKEKKRAYYLKHKEEKVSYDKEYKQKNRSKITQGKRRHYEKYYPEHKKEYTSRTALRRAKPSWLTQEQLNQMSELYVARPEGYEVDHIVPLQGKTVCGLHVPWNLQYLTKKENRSKWNNHGNDQE
jgi:hypothetical protein